MFDKFTPGALHTQNSFESCVNKTQINKHFREIIYWHGYNLLILKHENSSISRKLINKQIFLSWKTLCQTLSS